ncbi:NAD-dependent epimerase/dehydratase family protein [Shewanella sp. A25]|nr:NAD-dependent epimerase/dehydratase family protein [Shewanella shenzhenensis]
MTQNTTPCLALTQLHAKEQRVLGELAAQARHAFVTGAGGFLGKAICLRLLAVGIKVTGFARGHYPELEAQGVTMVQGDLANAGQLLSAMQDCDMVFHVASKAGVWGSKQSYFEPNVKGTENVLDACRKLNISTLVYTSTPSVTFAGVDESGIDETTPYADVFLNHYAHSKAIAEAMVLKAASDISRDGYRLKTVAIRPHLIWGPEDPHLVPRVLARARTGKLKLVGSEDKLVDTIYVDNAAYAHLLAALELCQAQPKCLGQAYFVSNDEPVTMAHMLNLILACDNLPPVTKRVPKSIAYGVGAVLEGIYHLLNKQEEPIMTRFVARQLSCSHYFDISAAKRDFGYTALVTIEEGMARLKASIT